jgi:hypothetical protein
MKFKTFAISFWVIALAFIIGVYVQRDDTSTTDALTWLGVSSFIFALGCYLKYRADKKKGS